MITTLVLLLSLVLAGQGAVAPPRAPVVAVTQHTTTINGGAVAYTATISETFIAGPDGSPAAVMINTAYTRDGVADKAKRPVMFIFNGGPGASSSPLHFSALGPRRNVRAGAERGIQPNPYSPLDVVDLVFIDPIGTGFSRPLPGVDGQPFWSVSGDGASVATFIKGWLKANGREASPRFLCGESYGTVRAGEIVAATKDLAFDGVLLFSMTGGERGSELSYVFTLPTFAATAAFHGKVDAAGRGVADIFEEAATFARTEYVGALIQGASLPAAEKARLAQELSKRIGLPADFIAEKNLRVSKADFYLNLLKDKGLRTGQLDARATGAIAEYADRQPPYDDPSMGRGPQTPRGGGPGAAPGAAAPAQAPPSPMQAYFTGDLKFDTKESYRGLNLEINSKWKFDVENAMSDPAGRIGSVLREQPKMHVFWAAGYYDITTPLYAGRYILDHAGIPADRLTLAMFPTGHSVFEGDDNLDRFTKAIRAFVQAR